ncbi:uncharacterized protein A1O9_06230 [Exophiala aquamarina CBS 119918]|uniref:AAA+ ATPase domain-containing protein n=1 Tax=Exophiala aquamarina CBS 119918 TaxID=1182545 RepID=A0A072PE09_9EURO|nr:uncharacterized protein A1O9_06230 [Exophiala aquamarina CBS 119918]KEF58304.1 hypothetical protein A1O9_06230 [Exophiala aquamarina CBS 119918]
MDQTTSGLTEAKNKKIEPATDRSAITKANSTESPKDQKKHCKKHAASPSKRKLKHSSKPKKSDSSETSSSSCSESSDPSSTSDSSTDSENDSSTDSTAERKKLKAKKLKAKLKAQAKMKKQKKARKRAAAKAAALAEEEEEDSSYTDSESEEELLQNVKPSRTKPAKRTAKKARDNEDSDHVEYEEDPNSARLRAMKTQLHDLRFVQPGSGVPVSHLAHRGQIIPPVTRSDNYTISKRRSGLEERALVKETKPPKHKIAKRASKVAYKRVDQLWDQGIHNFKLTETAKNTGEAVWDQYIFTVRRKFDWEQKYQGTVVDIKSTPLKDSLHHIMAGVKGVSLVGETLHMDPNMLFLYLEEMRNYVDILEQSASTRKRKERKALATQIQHLRVMVRYLDKDFAETKRNLYPMLENNQITFDLLWALYKPNTIAYCSTYGDSDEGRAFKIDFATKDQNFMKGVWYNVEGRYLEYDGKSFGMGTLHNEVQAFQGVRKISSLECFPLQYHRDPKKIREQLIERGKKFVQLQGMNHRYHKGMAYAKRKKQVLKINIDGRIMVDPAIHRRINPNYPVSTVKKNSLEGNNGDDSDAECGCGDDSSSDDGVNNQNTPSEDTIQERKRFKAVKMPNGQTAIILVSSKDDPDADALDESRAIQPQESHEFSEEELLLASPVVLGFAFGEKLWLEFTVSGISDIVYNDEAFDTLVLPENQKDIIKALVSSHAFHAHKSIDDIISGKGRGLVAVLHGRPGTGKTLTAEGIADLLKCPLYMVSAGDLGTDPTRLEKELQNILDIAHSWGAILLLDEADVFLEQRSIHDIHRNALVSIFLRLLEYFQGILFLTTNRVETFDSAFVSRIHLSLRFQDLTTKAKRTVWNLFIDRVRKQEGMEVGNITETDLSDLARRDVNGRQIKNLVRAAQALAIHEEKPLSMVHIRRVIEVAESFENDLKGGTGFTDAMRSESPYV